MSKGFLIYAENKNDIDYVKQAYALALSIKFSQKTVNSVSLVTNNTNTKKKYKRVFDQIISIPWYDSPGSAYSAQHRWKLYHVSPYEETIVLDSDMLLLEDVTTWWEYCSNFDIKYCSKIKTYKNEIIQQDTVHRKTFIENNLSNPYFALHYFKKSLKSEEFYKVLEFVTNNWELCYGKFAPENYQNWPSMDLISAIAIEIADIRNEATDVLAPLEFVHMKPSIQNWTVVPTSWQNAVKHYLNARGDLYVGNIKQSKLFHYVEKDFLTDSLIKQLEDLANA